jgi:phosphate transport system protein
MARIAFQQELDELEERTLGGLDSVRGELAQAIEAVERRDAVSARAVIAADTELHTRCTELHHDLLSCIARQIPVAGDLRLLVALMQVVQHVERMSDQVANLARLAITLEDCRRLDDRLLGCLYEMAHIAGDEIAKARAAFAGRDVALARELVRDDQAVNQRNRTCFQLAVELGRDAELRPVMAEVALTARAVERIGDNAVDVGEQAAFVVTGELREFSDASHPVPAGT